MRTIELRSMFLVGKTQTRTNIRNEYRQEDNIEMNHNEIGCKVVAEYMCSIRTSDSFLRIREVSLPVPWNAVSFLAR